MMSGSSSLYCRKTGAGRAILLLHGFPVDGSIWDEVAMPLSGQYTVLVPDLPGAGQSGAVDFKGIDDIASQLADFLVAAKYENVLVVGHSMGGYVALSLAQQYPGLVAGVSLVHSTPEADDDDKKENRRKAIRIIEGGGKDTFIKQLIPNLFCTEFKQTSPRKVERCVELGLGIEAASLVGYYSAMMDRLDYCNWLKNNKLPMQWIMGESDSILSFKKLILNCHHSDVNFVTLFTDCGNMSMIEQPSELVANLDEFAQYCFSR